MKDLPANPTDFYAHVGLAIVQWSKVEDALCDLFMRLTVCGLTGRGLGLGTDKKMPQGEGMFLLGNTFYTNTNLSSRLDLIKKMLKRLVSDKTVQAKGVAVLKEAGRLYGSRNVLAHGTAWAGDNCDPEFMRYSIFSTKVEELRFPQIREAVSEFAELADKISAFTVEVNELLASRNS